TRVLKKTLEALSNDSELGDVARGYLERDEFFENDKISNEHWKNVLIPFLTRHKLKNALSTEDEKKLVEMFGEKNEQKLFEQGNLKLVVSMFADQVPLDFIDECCVQYTVVEWAAVIPGICCYIEWVAVIAEITCWYNLPHLPLQTKSL
ncbi:916_t:CDS:2, partial [Acaulospora morrowiae]